MVKEGPARRDRLRPRLYPCKEGRSWNPFVCQAGRQLVHAVEAGQDLVPAWPGCEDPGRDQGYVPIVVLGKGVAMFSGQCIDCRFFFPWTNEEVQGDCRRHPPQYFIDVKFLDNIEKYEVACNFPFVNDDGWCGDGALK